MDRNEFRRLERAAEKANKNKNKQALYDWGLQLEQQIRNELEQAYEIKFKQDLEASIDTFLLAIMYVLHFSETTKFGNKRLNDIMEDITATVNMFYTGEYSPEDYKKQLEEDGIKLNKIKEKANEQK